ncbi:MAG: putative N-acetyltransferase YhbS [Bacteroidia bacterium]|jgi:predicted N-acetyltransferase YhbS
MPVQIRRAIPDDIERILPLARDFVTSFEVDGDKYRLSFSVILGNSDALVLVAEDNASLIGYFLEFCHGTFYANGNVAWLEEIMVSSAYRRQRVGESLMTGFEEWALL